MTKLFNEKVWSMYWPVAVQGDGSIGHDLEHQADGGSLVAVNSQETALLVVLTARARHHHQVAGALGVNTLQLDGLPTKTHHQTTIGR